VHELAIAESVVRIAGAHARGRRVARVEVRIGHLRQVVPSALELAFEVLVEGTPLQGAELGIEDVPAVVRCNGCGAETEVDWFPLACGACGGLATEVVRGEELYVESLELPAEAPA
jgi:hydrogenase nickel incorporation protein HypA/HybF